MRMSNAISIATRLVVVYEVLYKISNTAFTKLEPDVDVLTGICCSEPSSTLWVCDSKERLGHMHSRFVNLKSALFGRRFGPDRPAPSLQFLEPAVKALELYRNVAEKHAIASDT